MTWPFRRKTSSPPKPSPDLRWHQGDATFRERDDYVAWAKTMLTTPEGRALQAYLFSGVPQSVFYRGDKVDAIQAGLEYMRLVGYLECLNRLQEAGRHLPKPPPEIEADYDQTPPGQEPA